MGELTDFMNNIACKYEKLWCDKNIEPKISIIVPVYNVEKYIEKCLASILNQTFKEFEVIIVNDGSTDLTSIIANTFQQCDNRFKLINQENKGLSFARNVGIKNANAPYISFIDSDDFVDKNYLEKHYETIARTNADISASSIIRWRKKYQKYRIHYTKEEIVESLENKIKICDIPNCCYVWNKIYKKELVKNSLFADGKYFEDMLWTPKILKQSKKLVTVPDTNYYYRATKGSIVKKNSSKKQFDNYCAHKYIIEFFNENNLELSKKQKNITKEIKYFLNIPILKIKEKNFIDSWLLFGFLPVYNHKNICNICVKNKKHFFLIKILDSHIYIELFRKIKIAIKVKTKFITQEIGEYGLTLHQRTPKLIVSLTSYPARIETVHLAINTLLTQTIKPDKVILWLADSQFPNKEAILPKELLNLKNYGLEIKWCEDLKSYKKLVPALREFPNDIIITADDDIYYQQDWLESLYKSYLNNKNCIHTRRTGNASIKNKKIMLSSHYANKKYNPTYLNQLMGGAGTLYPPHSLYKDITNIEEIKSLIPTHDDIYFWAMAILNKTKIQLVKHKDINMFYIENTQNESLSKNNKQDSYGMTYCEAFEKILKYYPSIYNQLKTGMTDD